MSAKEDKKRQLGEYLKAADRFIQASELEQAMAQVKKALALEPDNTYALAYIQRIREARDAQRRREDAARVRSITEEKKGRASEPEPEAVTPAPPPPLSMPAHMQPIDAVTREELLRDVVRYLLLAENLSAEANDVMELIRARLGFDDDEYVRVQTSVKADLYKDALEKAWTRGGTDAPGQAENLAGLRKKIGLSMDDHARLDAEVRKAKKKR